MTPTPLLWALAPALALALTTLTSAASGLGTADSTPGAEVLSPGEALRAPALRLDKPNSAALASRGLSDDPIAAGELLYLDGDDWALTSEPLDPPGSAELPNCTHPNALAGGCCFAKGADWYNGIDGYGGTAVHADSPASCCAACAAAGADRCYVAVFLSKQCWLKSRKDAAGGNITAVHPGTVSCMPKTKPPPAAQPPQPPFSITGTVPGDLITDLEAAGLVGDPYFENNFLNSSLWSGLLWSYTKTFMLPSNSNRDALLVFEGIYTNISAFSTEKMENSPWPTSGWLVQFQ